MEGAMLSRRNLLGIALTGLGTGLTGGCVTLPGPGEEGWNVGNRIPDIALRNADGFTIRLSDYHDRAMLFYIGGEWCVHCRQGIPELAKTWRALKDDPRIAFVAMSYAEAPETTRRWINDKAGIGMTVLHPPSRSSRVPLVNGGHMAFSAPTVYVLIAGNIIHAWRVGASQDAYYRTALLEAAYAISARG